MFKGFSRLECFICCFGDVLGGGSISVEGCQVYRRVFGMLRAGVGMLPFWGLGFRAVASSVEL